MPGPRLRPLLVLGLLAVASPALADTFVPSSPPTFQQPTYVEAAPKGNIVFQKPSPGTPGRRFSDHARFLDLLCPPGSGPNPAGPNGCAPCRPLHKGDLIGNCAM